MLGSSSIPIVVSDEFGLTGKSIADANYLGILEGIVPYVREYGGNVHTIGQHENGRAPLMDI